MAETHVRLMAACGHLKEHSKVLSLAEEGAREFDGDGEAVYRLACAAAGSLSIVQEDTAVPEDRRAQAVDEYGRRIVYLLKMSSRGGFRDAARAEGEAALEPLRDRGDFQEWLRELPNTMEN